MNKRRRIFSIKRICKYCGKEFIAHSNKAKFHSGNCRQKYEYHHNKDYQKRVRKNSRIKYNKVRNNPVYKEKRKEYFKKWLDKNRAHYNDLMREPNRLREKALRLEAIRDGKCPSCFKNKLNDKEYKTCLSCREKDRTSKDM